MLFKGAEMELWDVGRGCHSYTGQDPLYSLSLNS